MEEWGSDGVLRGLTGGGLGGVLGGVRGGVIDGRSELAGASRIPYPMHSLATAPCYRPPPPSLTPYAGRSQLLFTDYCPQLQPTATVHTFRRRLAAACSSNHSGGVSLSRKAPYLKRGGEGVDGMGLKRVGWGGWDGMRCGMGYEVGLDWQI